MSDQPIPSLPVEQNQARFRELVAQALDYARSLGATDAAAEVSESRGLSVSVRNQDLETVEQTRDRSLDVTVFSGQRAEHVLELFPLRVDDMAKAQLLHGDGRQYHI